MGNTVVDHYVSEKVLQAAIIELAELFGWMVYHTFDSRRSHKGFPDLVMVRGQRVLFVELKTAKGRVKPEQQLWLDRLSEAGQETYLWRPDHWLEGIVEKVLR